MTNIINYEMSEKIFEHKDSYHKLTITTIPGIAEYISSRLQLCYGNYDIPWTFTQRRIEKKSPDVYALIDNNVVNDILAIIDQQMNVDNVNITEIDTLNLEDMNLSPYQYFSISKKLSSELINNPDIRLTEAGLGTINAYTNHILTILIGDIKNYEEQKDTVVIIAEDVPLLIELVKNTIINFDVPQDSRVLSSVFSIMSCTLKVHSVIEFELIENILKSISDSFEIFKYEIEDKNKLLLTIKQKYFYTNTSNDIDELLENVTEKEEE